MLRMLPIAAALLASSPAGSDASDPPPAEAAKAEPAPQTRKTTKTGEAAAKLLGQYSIFLDAKTTAQLEKARKDAADAAPDSMEAQLFKMMEAMTQVRVTFKPDEMSVSMGGEQESLPYTVVSSTADTVVFETIGGKGNPDEKQRYTARLTEQGFVMIEDGAPDKATTFIRVK